MSCGLGLRIPYFHNGQEHDYEPDSIVRLKRKDGKPPVHLIVETKGYDPWEEVKVASARRWVDAVNAGGEYGRWGYAIGKSVADVGGRIEPE